MSDPAEPAITALAGSTTETVGTFRYDLPSETWWWSPSVYAMHGFEPGDIVPTSALMTAHQHPDDRAAAGHGLTAAIHAGTPFCSRHRIVDARQRVRTVVTLGEGRCDSAGTVSQIHGYIIDVTDTVHRELTAASDLAVRNAAASRAAIEQAKGALMITYGLDEDEAFALLRRHSQHSNIKLRAIAATITDRATDPDLAGLPAASRITHILTDLTQQLIRPTPTETPHCEQTEERMTA
jgi:hypothetical protein